MSYYRTPDAILKVDVKELPLSIEWDDIQVEWERDDLSFEDAAEDGVSLEWINYRSIENGQRYGEFALIGNNSNLQRIVIDPRRLTESYKYFRETCNYTKQAAAESTASLRRSMIENARNLAENGTSYVVAHWGDFRAGCGGYEYDVKPEHGREEIENEMRGEVAAEMIDAGFEIVGAPVRTPTRPHYLNRRPWRERLSDNRGNLRTSVYEARARYERRHGSE